MPFTDEINAAYTFKGDALRLGSGMLHGAVVAEALVSLPLKTMNRHGLISGATGTGKTKTLQLIAEGLSDASVPVVMMDIKGDLSGLAAAGLSNDKISERATILGIDWQPSGYPIELMSLSEEPGVRLRATVSEFGPILLSRILGLNDTQQGILAMLFKYCDDHTMPLLDLADLQRVLQWAANEGKDELSTAYGTLSSASVGTIMRKVVELQQQGANRFFGEKSFEVDDLMRLSPDGRGMINIIRLTDLQDRPKLFSTFMLQMLAELYGSLPEAGDTDRPKLVLFIDEAHLLFKEASKALLDQLETVVKLIRSKGVGIFFCTQNPTDISAAVLSQLGMKVQHALRAFTAADRKTIVQVSANYPDSAYYKTTELLTQLGTGEAFITLLNEKGIPTPLVHTMLCPPRSRMDILSADELQVQLRKSALLPKYSEDINRESAYEMLNKKLEFAKANPPVAPAAKTNVPAEKTWMESAADNTVVRSMMRTAGNALVRTLMGALGLGGTSRKRK